MRFILLSVFASFSSSFWAFFAHPPHMQAFQVKELLRMRFMIVIILLSVFASFSSSFSSSHSPCSVHPLHTTYVASDKDFQGFFKAFSRIFLKFLSLVWMSVPAALYFFRTREYSFDAELSC